ncbi:MAG: RNA-binding protein, partial [Acidobacteria bacterium]
MAKRLYVGNLSFQVTEADLSELFAQVGSVDSVKLIT